MKPCFFLILLLTFTFCNAQPTGNDLDYFGLKGRVKTIRAYRYQCEQKSGQPVKGERLPMVSGTNINKGDVQDWLSFNESGQLVLSRNYQETDNLYGEKRYSYNRLNQLVEERNYAHVEGEKLLLKKIYLYDEAGRLQEIRYVGPDSMLKEKTVFLYNKADQRPFTGNVFYRQDTATKITYGYTWDSSGWITELKIYSKNNPPRVVQPENLLFHAYNSEEEKKKGNYFLFEEDKTENWIRSVVYRGSRPAFIIEREIVYYEP